MNYNRHYGTIETTSFEVLAGKITVATAQNADMDFTARAGQLKVLPFDNKQPVINFDGVPLKLEPHAKGQLYKRLGSPYFKTDRSLPRDFMDAPGMPEDVWTTIINQGSAGMGPKARDWFVRGSNGPNGGTARALFTTAYKPFDGRDILGLIQPYHQKWAGQYQASFKGCVAQRDYTSVSLVMPGALFTSSTIGQAYQVGINIASGEIGQAGLTIAPFMLRTKCMNSFRVLAGGVRMRHIFSATTIEHDFVDIVKAMGTNLGIALDAMVLASEVEIPDLAVVMRGFCVEHGYGQETLDTAMTGHEGMLNLDGLLQGVTHASKFAPDAVTAARMQEDAIFALFPKQKEEDTEKNTWDMTSLSKYEMQDRVTDWRELGMKARNLPASRPQPDAE